MPPAAKKTCGHRLKTKSFALPAASFLFPLPCQGKAFPASRTPSPGQGLQASLARARLLPLAPSAARGYRNCCPLRASPGPLRRPPHEWTSGADAPHEHEWSRCTTTSRSGTVSKGRGGSGGEARTDQVSGEGLLAPRAGGGVAYRRERRHGAVRPGVLERNDQRAVPCPAPTPTPSPSSA